MKNKFLFLVVLMFGLFSCSKPGPISTSPVAELTTTMISVITQHTAQGGGNVSSDGGHAVTTRGVCWSASHNPTTANSKTADGTGTGNYNSVLTQLLPNTIYYVRAYAVNSQGTAYGTEVTFMTQQVSSTSVTDIDGNEYPVVTIGTQTWMKENLKTTRYRNGEAIPTGLNDNAWNNTITGAFVNYNNETANNAVYGRLYNWYTGIDTRNVAPAGWHVPTVSEWMTLINFLGGDNLAGAELKEDGLGHWITPNTGATNSSGFKAIPGGYRQNDGAFAALGNAGYWWTNTEASPGGADAEAVALFYDRSESPQVTGNKKIGASIRCIKD